jgi:hypothetical protein
MSPSAASVTPRTRICVHASPREGSTNCGKKARKNSVTLGLKNLHDYALREGARERFRLDGRGGIFLTAAEQALETEPDQVRCAQPLDDREGGRGGRQERRESYSGEGGVRQGADLDAEAGHEPRQPATLHAPSHDVEDRRARQEQERQRGDDEEPERG